MDTKKFVDFFNHVRSFDKSIATVAIHEKEAEFDIEKTLVTDGEMTVAKGKKVVKGFSYIIEVTESYFNGATKTYLSLHFHTESDGREVCRGVLLPKETSEKIQLRA